MLDILRRQQTDIVVASRYVASGAADGLSAKRRMLSRAGVRLARVLLKSDITDPVSGFFMMRSEVVEKAAARLSGVGTKILIDLLCSSPGSLSVAELPYRFRGRYSGSSKLDWLTVLEYLVLLAEKVSGRYLPSKFLLFGLVGASGVVVHLVVLRVLLASAGTGFCRRPIGCDGNRDGLELLQQHLDLSRLPARRLGGIAWSRLLYGDLRPRCRRQRPGGSRLVRNDPDVAACRRRRCRGRSAPQLCAHLDVHLGAAPVVKFAHIALSERCVVGASWRVFAEHARPRCSKPRPAGCAARWTCSRRSDCRRCSTSAAARPISAKSCSPGSRISCFVRCGRAASRSSMSTCVSCRGSTSRPI